MQNVDAFTEVRESYSRDARKTLRSKRKTTISRATTETENHRRPEVLEDQDRAGALLIA
jgi:hypothetical protein